MNDAKAFACMTEDEASQFAEAFMKLGYRNVLVVGEVDSVGLLKQQDAKWMVVASSSPFKPVQS